MKKTLVALAVTAFAASATAKISLFEQDGTSVSTYGQIKVVAHKETEKEKGKKTVNKHSNLSNDGSRIGFDVKHNFTEEFYGLGRIELRFDKDATNEANFGNVYAKRAYAGLGHKQLGQVTFGRQLLTGDDIGRIGLDNYYGVGSSLSDIGSWTILNESSDSAVRYSYTAVEGLTFGADYSFANEHDSGKAEKNGYGAGAIYEFAAGEGTASVALGYAHKDFEVKTSDSLKDQDGVFGGFDYIVNGVKFGVDGGVSVRKKVNDNKDKLRYIRTGLRYDVAGTQSGIYGNYSHIVVKSGDNKSKAHRFLLGTDYKFHKNVKVFLEGQVDKLRFANKSKRTDKMIATGLVVLW